MKVPIKSIEKMIWHTVHFSSLLSIIMLLSSCYSKRVVDTTIPYGNHYRLTITLPYGANIGELDAVMREGLYLGGKLDNNYNIINMLNFKSSAHDISFIFQHIEAIQDLMQDIQLEGVAIQGFTIQKNE
jgi:hypothetical protein